MREHLRLWHRGQHLIGFAKGEQLHGPILSLGNEGVTANYAAYHRSDGGRDTPCPHGTHTAPLPTVGGGASPRHATIAPLNPLRVSSYGVNRPFVCSTK